MKIREIIYELDVSKQVGRDVVGGTGKGIGAVAGGIVGAGKATAKGWNAGAGVVDKILSPSKWFSKDTAEKPEKITAGALEIRDTLRSIAGGSPATGNDTKILKQLKQDIFSGKILSHNVENEMAALQAAAQGQTLSPEQLQIIKQIHNRY